MVKNLPANAGDVGSIPGSGRSPREHFKRLNTGFVFFSRDSFEEDTWDYLADCMNYKTADSVFVFEGIHHNRDMEDAWEEIKANEDVSVTFDLFCVGMVFFREGIEKQDFVLKY